MCLRLAVWLTPVALKGPRISKELTRSTRSWPPPGVYICRRSSDSAKRAVAEGHDEAVHAGLRVEADVLQALVDGIDRRILLLVDGLHVLLAADGRFVDQLAVERDDQVVLELHVVDPQGLRHVGDVQHVLAVGREVVVDGDAAARAQRQAILVEQLRAGLLRAIGGAGGQRILVAHGLHDHGARGGDVLVEEGRRDLQRGGDVVEALARLVARQHVGRIDLDAEQVAHGVGVFLAVQAMQADMARIRMRLAGLVEVAFHPGDERGARGLVRHLVAAGRHLLAAQLAHDLLEHVDVLGDIRLGHRVEGDAAGPVLGVVALGAVGAEQFPAG